MVLERFAERVTIARGEPIGIDPRVARIERQLDRAYANVLGESEAVLERSAQQRLGAERQLHRLVGRQVRVVALRAERVAGHAPGRVAAAHVGEDRA